MVKPLNYSARPGQYFIFPARPVIKFFILGQAHLGPRKSFKLDDLKLRKFLMIF